MSNESTVLSFEDAKLRTRGSRRASASRPYSDTRSTTSSLSRSDSLRSVFEVSFDSQDDLEYGAHNDFSNTALGVSADDIAEVEEEIGTASKKGFFARCGDALSKRKRARNKARADKAFQSSFGSADADAVSSAGPRAALYKAEMGSKQRRATRMQETGKTWGTGLSFSLPSISLPDVPRKIMATVCAAGCVIMLVGMLYTPTQQYYQQMRERDRLTAEYEAIIERNDSLQGLVDNLHSDEGIEDKAHSEFGLIKEGEQAGAVTGFVVDSPSDFKANIAPGSISAPDTWYSGVLDFLFGYSN